MIVMDESDETLDRDFVRRMQRYFTRTETGRYRTSRIVPVPFFVASDMTALVQVADVIIYCLNWGFRLPSEGMDAPVRDEIASEFGPYIRSMQFHGDGYRDGQTFSDARSRLRAGPTYSKANPVGSALLYDTTRR